MRPRLALTGFLAAIAISTAPLSAQSPPSESEITAPAHVSRVEGAATLEREGRAESSPLNMPLLSGDRLKTADGRVEVQFADGSTLHLDSGSTIDVQSDDLVRLTEGRLRLNILGPAGAVAYRIDSPAGSARITQPGEYRLALLKGTEETQLELAVLRGSADIFTDLGTTPVRAGERAYASAGLAPSYAYSYNSANWDAFDRWSEERRNVRLGASSQYLPADMQSYAPLLDESGDWRQTESYGYAWYPRVAADWRPYYNGRWDSYPRYGWTWIGADRFAWPTHHYGRWGFSAGVWFWIPSSHWAPAYVSWGYAPGYVSWCPLGYDNRAVFGIDLYRVGPGYYSSGHGWTSVSYSHFGRRGYYVNQHAVNWDRVDRNQRPRFETRPSSPAVSRDVAVPRASTRAQGAASNVEGRNSTPVSWAGSRSLAQAGGRNTAAPRDPVPGRTAVPRYINRGDQIVRSATERPMPPPSSSPVERRALDRGVGAARPDAAAVPRAAEPRTVPDGPARPAQPAFPEAPNAARAMPRGYGYPQTGRPGVDDRRAYQPADRGAPRSVETAPRQAAPRAEPAAPQAPSSTPVRQPGPAAYERPRPGAAPPQRYPAPDRAAAERAPEPSPGRSEPRQAPQPERAAPVERQAPRSSGGDAAVQRPSPGTQPAPSRRGGRGGV
jgi:hypothetical protein